MDQFSHTISHYIHHQRRIHAENTREGRGKRCKELIVEHAALCALQAVKHHDRLCWVLSQRKDDGQLVAATCSFSHARIWLSFNTFSSEEWRFCTLMNHATIYSAGLHVLAEYFRIFLFLLLDGKSYEVKEGCEGALIRRPQCTYIRQHNVTTDSFDVSKTTFFRWSKTKSPSFILHLMHPYHVVQCRICRLYVRYQSWCWNYKTITDMNMGSSGAEVATAPLKPGMLNWLWGGLKLILMPHILPTLANETISEKTGDLLFTSMIDLLFSFLLSMIGSRSIIFFR